MKRKAGTEVAMEVMIVRPSCRVKECLPSIFEALSFSPVLDIPTFNADRLMLMPWKSQRINCNTKKRRFSAEFQVIVAFCRCQCFLNLYANKKERDIVCDIDEYTI